MDPHDRSSRQESALIVVRFFGVVAVLGWTSFGLLSVAAAVGMSGLLGPLAMMGLILLGLAGYLSIAGAIAGLAWAGPRADWALGRDGYAWLAATASLAIFSLLGSIGLFPSWLVVGLLPPSN